MHVTTCHKKLLRVNGSIMKIHDSSKYFFFVTAVVAIVVVDSQNTGQCNICGTTNATIRATAIPTKLSQSDIPPFLDSGQLPSATKNSSVTCAEWQSFVDIQHSISETYDIAHRKCLSFQNWLQYLCCDGISTPLYECQKVVKNKLLISTDDGVPYDKEVAPIDGASKAILDVHMILHITDFSIVNFGVGGGAIEVIGTANSKWVDRQLKWDPEEYGGCTQIELKASHQPAKSDIWVPFRASTTKTESSSVEKATILADGSVDWKSRVELDLPCKQIKGEDSKLCRYVMSAKKGLLWGGDAINYVVGSSFYDDRGGHSNGILIDDLYSIPGYVVNKKQTISEIILDGTTGDTEIAGQIKLDPVENTTCSLCGGIDNVSLRSERTPMVFNDGIHIQEVNNLTCGQIEDLLLTYANVGDENCLNARTFYTESCCKGVPSRNECEDNVRNQIMLSFDGDGEVAPPDPPEGEPMVEVQVYLHFTHILDIDIKSNTLEILASLSLVWNDERIRWERFIGQCSAVSFRASLDPEATEIWVPEIDLMNQVEGTSNLPNSFATAFSWGAVLWRRTGVLKVACDLDGVKYFPFDHPTCSLDFGALRSPLAHRVNYTVGNFSFSDRLKQRSGKYQEYHIDVNKTVMSLESEMVPLYENRFIRFSLVFDRAVPYYIWAFVVLYILFTYLSFGMFFLDQQVGERLGFGTGILFVIVAQDITVAGFTPVTHEQLWINQLSFGSKMFVIFSIVQSVAILHYYFVNDIDGSGVDNELNTESTNETESLVIAKEETADSESSESELFHSDNGQIQRSSIASPIGADKQSSGLEMTVGINLPEDPCEARSMDDPEEAPSRKGRSITTRSIITTRRNILRLGNCSKYLVKHVLGYKVGSNASLNQQKVLKLRLWDLFTAIFFFFAYTLFVVIMFIIGIRKGGED